jgi:hypothetical protein
MDAVGWSVRDPLHRAVLEAFNAVHGLNVELHYLSCSPGTVGRAKPELKEGETPEWIQARREDRSG